MDSKKILIIDDAPFIREILINYLEQQDQKFEVKEAENGEEGVSLFKEFKPNLVFMDIVMPVLSGIEATKQIRKLDTSVPIIGLSTLDEGAVINQLLEAGATVFLKKPFDLQILNKTLETHLK